MKIRLLNRRVCLQKSAFQNCLKINPTSSSKYSPCLRIQDVRKALTSSEIFYIPLARISVLLAMLQQNLTQLVYILEMSVYILMLQVCSFALFEQGSSRCSLDLRSLYIFRLTLMFCSDRWNTIMIFVFTAQLSRFEMSLSSMNLSAPSGLTQSLCSPFKHSSKSMSN